MPVTSTSLAEILAGVTEAPPTDFSPIASGDYDLALEAEGVVYQSGAQAVKLKCRVLTEGPYVNRVFFTSLFLTPKAAPISAITTKVFGVSLDRIISENLSIEAIAAAIDGHTVSANVAHRKGGDDGQYDNYNVRVKSILATPSEQAALNANPAGLPVPAAAPVPAAPVAPAAPSGPSPWESVPLPNEPAF